MFPATKTVFALTNCHRVRTVTQLSRPNYRCHSKVQLVAYCTTNQNYQASDGTIKEDTPKIELGDRLKSLHQKPRPFALPNLISATRLLLAPATGYFILHGMNSCALACVATAMFTDVADKAVAKLLKDTSNIQLAVDMIADRVFSITTMICLYKVDYMPLWLIKGLIVREVCFSIAPMVYRYFGFGENTPSLKQFFDLHNYPTLGMGPTITSRICISLQYSLYIYYLYQASLGVTQIHGGWDLLSFEIATAASSAFSFGAAVPRLYTPKFYTRPVKQ